MLLDILFPLVREPYIKVCRMCIKVLNLNIYTGARLGDNDMQPAIAAEAFHSPGNSSVLLRHLHLVLMIIGLHTAKGEYCVLGLHSRTLCFIAK